MIGSNVVIFINNLFLLSQVLLGIELFWGRCMFAVASITSTQVIRIVPEQGARAGQ